MHIYDESLYFFDENCAYSLSNNYWHSSICYLWGERSVIHLYCDGHDSEEAQYSLIIVQNHLYAYPTYIT